ncbi:MAG: quinol oxidase, partial [Alphaproteobacteria bacterium]|nr:quinol oxidase [Alphaproteobacteria bacterium]
AGIALIAGLMTRLAALATIGFSIVLQLMFGWQGGTCIDEWTMAACNLAIGATLLLAGSGAYSADNALLRRHPGLAAHAWFRWAAGSLPLPLAATAYRNLGLVLLALVVAFNVGTYSYLRGSVVTRYHAGRVSPTMHHFTLSDGRLLRDGAVRFDIYLDGGTPDIPAHIMKAELLAADGQPIETWSSEALSRLPAQAIRNDFDYNKFGVGPYGIVAQMGARATITLPPASDFAAGAARGVTFRLTDVDDGRFSVKLAEGQ